MVYQLRMYVCMYACLGLYMLRVGSRHAYYCVICCVVETEFNINEIK